MLTKIQQETIDAISQYTRHRGQSPTLEELAGTLGVHVTSIADRIRALVKKGVVTREPHKRRSLRIVDRATSHVRRLVPVPMIASVGADNLNVFAEQQFHQFLRVEEGLLRGHHDVFAVQVKGNSMRDANIHDGDYVIAEEASLEEVKNGEKVIAVDGDMVVLKTIKKGADSIMLCPENKSYQPILISGDREDFRIIGRFIDVIRFSLPNEEEEWVVEAEQNLS